MSENHKEATVASKVDFRRIDQMTDTEIAQLEWSEYRLLRGTLMGQISAAFDHEDVPHLNLCNRLLDRLEHVWMSDEVSA